MGGVVPREEWRAIAGYEGRYEVSDLGRVRSLTRTVTYKTGVTRLYPGQILKPHGSGHPMVSLGKYDPKSVHRLVAEAFLPNPEGLPLVRHWDDDETNNRASNLRWGTASDNRRDSVRNGTHFWARRETCHKGHPFSEENTRRGSKGDRVCKQCDRDRGARYRARLKMKGDTDG